MNHINLLAKKISRPSTAAGILSLILFLTNVCWAYQVETSFWTERAKSREPDSSHTTPLTLAQLPTQMGPIRPVSPFAPTPSLVQKTDGRNLPSDLIQAIPPIFGAVKKTILPSRHNKGKTVIHIQDVHLNPEAQTNIGLILQSLINQKKIDLIALEGAFQELPLTPYRQDSLQEATRIAANYFFKEKKISGALHAALTSPTDIPPLVGIDDKTHYVQNVEAYKTSAGQVTRLKQEWAAERHRWTKEMEHQLNPGLRDRLKLVHNYHDGKINLREYVELLSAPKEHTLPLALSSLREALRMEHSLDVSSVERERTELLSQLIPRLSPNEGRQILNWSVAFRQGSLRPTDFYQHIRSLSAAKGIPLTRYPKLISYIQYVLLSDSLDAEKTLRELAQFENDFLADQIRSSREKEIVARGKYLALAGKLMDFSLTKEDWKEYQAIKSSPSFFLPPKRGGQVRGGGLNPRIPPPGRERMMVGGMELRSFERFYEEADARDDAMAANLLREMEARDAQVAVLITGGFHSEGINQHINKAGLATLTVVPKITKVEGENGPTYLSAFLQEKTPLDRLFEGEKLFLSPLQEPNPAALALTTAATDAILKQDPSLVKQDWEKVFTETGQALKADVTVTGSECQGRIQLPHHPASSHKFDIKLGNSKEIKDASVVKTSKDDSSAMNLQQTVSFMNNVVGENSGNQFRAIVLRALERHTWLRTNDLRFDFVYKSDALLAVNNGIITINYRIFNNRIKNEAPGYSGENVELFDYSPILYTELVSNVFPRLYYAHHPDPHLNQGQIDLLTVYMRIVEMLPHKKGRDQVDLRRVAEQLKTLYFANVDDTFMLLPLFMRHLTQPQAKKLSALIEEDLKNLIISPHFKNPQKLKHFLAGLGQVASQRPFPMDENDMIFDVMDYVIHMSQSSAWRSISPSILDKDRGVHRKAIGTHLPDFDRYCYQPVLDLFMRIPPHQWMIGTKSSLFFSEFIKEYIGKLPIPPQSGLDMFTGVGPQAIALAQAGVKNVVGIDVEREAVQAARQNAAAAELTTPIEFRNGDLFSALKRNEKFDLITGNPPYLAKNLDIISNKLGTAVLDGRFELIERFIKEGRHHLNPGGSILMIVSSLTLDQGLELQKLADHYHYQLEMVGKRARTKNAPNEIDEFYLVFKLASSLESETTAYASEGPAMRWSGLPLDELAHDVVNKALKFFFDKAIEEKKIAYRHPSTPRPDGISNSYLHEEGGTHWALFDPDGILEDAGVKIYTIDGLNEKIRELSIKRGLIHCPLDLVSHVGRTRRSIYMDDEYVSLFFKMPREWRAQWARHELAHIQNPNLSEEDVQRIAPLPTMPAITSDSRPDTFDLRSTAPIHFVEMLHFGFEVIFRLTLMVSNEYTLPEALAKIREWHEKDGAGKYETFRSWDTAVSVLHYFLFGEPGTHAQLSAKLKNSAYEYVIHYFSQRGKIVFDAIKSLTETNGPFSTADVLRHWRHFARETGYGFYKSNNDSDHAIVERAVNILRDPSLKFFHNGFVQILKTSPSQRARLYVARELSSFAAKDPLESEILVGISEALTQPQDRRVQAMLIKILDESWERLGIVYSYDEVAFAPNNLRARIFSQCRMIRENLKEALGQALVSDPQLVNTLFRLMGVPYPLPKLTQAEEKLAVEATTPFARNKIKRTQLDALEKLENHALTPRSLNQLIDRLTPAGDVHADDWNILFHKYGASIVRILQQHRQELTAQQIIRLASIAAKRVSVTTGMFGEYPIFLVKPTAAGIIPIIRDEWHRLSQQTRNQVWTHLEEITKSIEQKDFEKPDKTDELPDYYAFHAINQTMVAFELEADSLKVTGVKGSSTGSKWDLIWEQVYFVPAIALAFFVQSALVGTGWNVWLTSVVSMAAGTIGIFINNNTIIEKKMKFLSFLGAHKKRIAKEAGRIGSAKAMISLPSGEGLGEGAPHLTSPLRGEESAPGLAQQFVRHQLNKAQWFIAVPTIAAGLLIHVVLSGSVSSRILTGAVAALSAILLGAIPHLLQHKLADRGWFGGFRASSEQGSPNFDHVNEGKLAKLVVQALLSSDSLKPEPNQAHLAAVLGLLSTIDPSLDVNRVLDPLKLSPPSGSIYRLFDISLFHQELEKEWGLAMENQAQVSPESLSQLRRHLTLNPRDITFPDHELNIIVLDPNIEGEELVARFEQIQAEIEAKKDPQTKETTVVVSPNRKEVMKYLGEHNRAHYLQSVGYEKGQTNGLQIIVDENGIYNGPKSISLARLDDALLWLKMVDSAVRVKINLPSLDRDYTGLSPNSVLFRAIIQTTEGLTTLMGLAILDKVESLMKSAA